jgi:Glycosyltransferase family 9 (heptosyltransferase)
VKKETYLLHRYDGLGDALLISAVAYHLGQTINNKVWIITNHPALFKGNPHVWVLPMRKRIWGFRLVRFLRAVKIVTREYYMSYQERKDPPYGQVLTSPPEHLLSVLARKVGLEKAPKKPLIFLNKKEIARWKSRLAGKKWIAIHSSGPKQWTTNKEWYPERFIQVVEKLKERFSIVQLGVSSDLQLPVDLDLRGKVSPREAAAALSACTALIGLVGYLMHAAAAVDTPAVIIYGGFEAPWQSGYPWNENIFTDLACAPCWSMKECEHRHSCMDQIQASDVLSALERLLEKQPKY